MKLNWRRDIIYLSVMGMEVSVLYIVLALFNQHLAGQRLSLTGFFLLYPLSFLVYKVLPGFGGNRVSRWGGISLTGVAAILLISKLQLYSQVNLFNSDWIISFWRSFSGGSPEVLILFFGGILVWSAGARLAGLRIDFAACLGEFQFGLTILLLTLLSASLLNISISNGITLILWFAVSSLLAIPLAHAKEGSGWLSSLNQGHWLGLLVASIGLILILGLALSAALTPDFLRAVTDVIAWLWDRMMNGITWLLSLLPRPDMSDLPPIPPPDTTADAETQKRMRELIPDWLREPIRIGWTILVSGMLLGAIWRLSMSIAAWMRRRLATSDGEMEPIKGAFAADLMDLLRRILSRLFGFRYLKRKSNPKTEEVGPARQIYRQLLRWTSSRGWPRAAAQTPYEYRDKLGQLLPASAEALGFITRQYVGARYGLAAPTEAELLILQQQLEQLKAEKLHSPPIDTTKQGGTP